MLVKFQTFYTKHTVYRQKVSTNVRILSRATARVSFGVGKKNEFYRQRVNYYFANYVCPLELHGGRVCLNLRVFLNSLVNT